VTSGAALLARIQLLQKHNEKLAEIARLEKRSYTLRFAVTPTPPRQSGHH